MYVRSMVVGVVPEGLAAMPPGPELARVLADLDPALVLDGDLVEVLRAQSRQLAHDQARMFVVVSEVACRRPSVGRWEIDRGDHPDEYGAAEVRAALVWTRRFADAETDLAFTVVHDLPLVQQALLAGLIDRGRAWVFARHLFDLSPGQVAVVCAALVPVAPGLTTGQLAERIKRMVLELDPAFYQRRYRKAVRERMVVAYLDPDGTVVVSASGLPADEAAVAWARLDGLARAARRDGHPGTLHQIRADLVLGLLDGSLDGLSRGEILQALLERFAGRVEPEAEESAGVLVPAGPGGRGGGGGPGDAGAGGGGSAGGGSGGAGSGPADCAPAPPPTSGAPPLVDGRVGAEVRVPLSTVLGLDERAGELPGWGPIPGCAARELVWRQRRAQWRWVVVDDGGYLWAEGITRRRPEGAARGGPRGGVVELQVPATLLATLVAEAGKYGPWAGVIADIGARFEAHLAGQRADLDAHPDDRFPRAGLRRYVQVRDRRCVHPGCRASAVRADVDHTRDHVFGGPTTQDDLAPLCRHHHMLKTVGGWRLEQPEPGRFVWRSPLGQVYVVEPEPILPPPPEQVPRDPDPGFDDLARDDGDDAPDLSVRERAPPPQDPRGRWSPPAETGRDDPPPF